MIIPSRKQLAEKNILLCGDVMLDRYWQGDVSRISPEAPVPIVAVTAEDNRPGGAANVALNIAALGAQVTLLGLTGKDHWADILKQQLSDAGIALHLEALSTHPTISKLRILGQHQQLIRMDFETPFHDTLKTRLLADFTQLIETTDLVLLSDYAKGTLSDMQRLVQIARAHNKPVIIDPKTREMSQYRGATLITPNQHEFKQMVGEPAKDQAHQESQARALIADLELEALLITLGDEGMLLIEREGPAVLLPSQAQAVYDVTGAGDTVIAVVASGLAAGMRLSDAAHLANTAAALSVAQVGTAAISLDAIIAERQPAPALNQGVLSQAMLDEVMAESRRQGETLVMTNGCFDLLHPGHIEYLTAAKALGDRLIVAVNSDASVQRLKGPTRPVQPLSTRMAMLSALKAVDWVVAFEEDTPAVLINNLLPDYLVKGGDYQASEVAGAQAVIAHGGEVVILPFKAGFSTSQMIKTIQGR
jgi:D-beta-D-heptose 7-phosphate kinase/D-beta-D-heptose 1-phosphate adenosyltransferase